MTVRPPVLEERAEAACRLLSQTLGLHRSQLVSDSSSRPVSRLDPPNFDGLQVMRQGTLLRLISITEAFCVDRLLEFAESEVEPSASKVRGHIWERASTGAIGNWKSLKDSYATWYDVRPDWRGIDQLVEVRNSIAHGLGRLTRIQRVRRQATVSKIQQAGVRLDADAIVLEETNLEAAREVCVTLVTEIDLAVQQLGPRQVKSTLAASDS